MGGSEQQARTNEVGCRSKMRPGEKTKVRTASSDIGNHALTPEWLYEEGLSTGAIALFGLLGCYADRKTNACWPSRATLAKRMSTTTRSIDRWSKELENVGAIKVTARKSKNGGQTPNIIRLTYGNPR